MAARRQAHTEHNTVINQMAEPSIFGAGIDGNDGATAGAAAAPVTETNTNGASGNSVNSGNAPSRIFPPFNTTNAAAIDAQFQNAMDIEIIDSEVIDLTIDDIDELQSTPSTTTLVGTESTMSTSGIRSDSSMLFNIGGQQQNDTASGGADPTSPNVLDCPICLQTCIHPARLPCGHIFCFLCVKGVAYKNRRCAMCRREIPPEYLLHPQLVNGIDDIATTKATEDGYQWFYEGRNGWWQYDDRTSQDIEEAFKKGEKSCMILVAGYVYIVDFESMLQQRQNEPTRCRRVKRDLATIPKKGVAGLRIEGNTVATDADYILQGNLDMMARQYHIQPDEPIMRNFQDASTSASSSSLVFPAVDYIFRMAATDAAIRVASDIIGSTLAHADELTRHSGVSGNVSGPNNGVSAGAGAGVGVGVSGGVGGIDNENAITSYPLTRLLTATPSSSSSSSAVPTAAASAAVAARLASASTSAAASASSPSTSGINGELMIEDATTLSDTDYDIETLRYHHHHHNHHNHHQQQQQQQQHHQHRLHYNHHPLENATSTASSETMTSQSTSPITVIPPTIITLADVHHSSSDVDSPTDTDITADNHHNMHYQMQQQAHQQQQQQQQQLQQQPMNIFEQTLNDFQELTLQNIADSSDDDNNDNANDNSANPNNDETIEDAAGGGGGSVGGGVGQMRF